MTATEYIVLVDENDLEVGVAEKLSAHKKNLLHRAFSVFIFRKTHQVELLLQQRAAGKYHSPHLWTNTCCSHPRPGEEIITAGERRLYEELGLKATLKNQGWFHYNAHFSNGLAENEIDHVLVGHVAVDTVIQMNAEEVQAYRWITIPDVEAELAHQPEQFTPWFAEALKLATSHQNDQSHL